jgi:hypothetical protein
VVQIGAVIRSFSVAAVTLNVCPSTETYCLSVDGESLAEQSATAIFLIVIIVVVCGVWHVVCGGAGVAGVAGGAGGAGGAGAGAGRALKPKDLPSGAKHIF